MRTINEFLLTFLLNSLWQVTLIASVAVLCARLLRNTPARYQHALWVLVLILSFGLPVLTSLSLSRGAFPTPPTGAVSVGPVNTGGVTRPDAPAPQNLAGTSVNLNGGVVAGLLALYLLFLLCRGVKLFRAWRRTRSIKAGVRPVEVAGPILTILTRAQRAFGVARALVACSDKVSVPITVGVLKPLVVLPDALLSEADPDVLTSAIGHELAHVSRRDYFFNLVYEFIFLPLSFHPAAALARRRIVQTRELVCDELVAERLLDREVYARSLVRMAGAAVPFGRRAGTVSVGINDADILEVRIMSLLRRTTEKARGGGVWLIAALALLAAPCVAAGAFALSFTIAPPGSAGGVQELPSGQEQEREEKAKREARSMDEREMKERAERDPHFKAELEARERHMREEREFRDRQQAELARLAKVSMDQAIQIANGQYPGKVLECSLVGERWESPGKLAKNGQVLYHVVILSGDEANPARTHVLVDAVDGTILKSEVELRRKGPDKEQL